MSVKDKWVTVKCKGCEKLTTYWRATERKFCRHCGREVR